jgi:hypothetical protein
MEIIRQVTSDTLVLGNLKTLLGKRVKINIEIIDEEKPGKQKQKPLGKYKLGKELDDVSIRDFTTDK